MNLEDFFQPCDLSVFEDEKYHHADSLLQHVRINSAQHGFPGDADVDVVLLGVSEYRGAGIKPPSENAADKIRRAFYSLKKHGHLCRMADLGNFIPGHSIEDSYHAVGAVITDLLQRNIIPFIIGGSQDLTYAHYLGYENLEHIINITGIDPSFDLGAPEEPLNHKTYIGKIVLRSPNYLFNYTNIGYQTFYVGQEQVSLMEKLYFDAFRVGKIREDLKEAEPMIRNADVLSFDLSSIRQSDAPACIDPSPNGFYGEEACQLMYYAGMNDKLTGAGLYNYDPEKDHTGQTAGLAAQMIWYFMEGFANRKMDLPVKAQEQHFTIYRVPVSSYNQEIIFLKSHKTERWWIELPSAEANRMLKNHFLPCSQKDYEQACSNEIPDRWWHALQKMS
jgi:arginase family enzyme